MKIKKPILNQKKFQSNTLIRNKLKLKLKLKTNNNKKLHSPIKKTRKKISKNSANIYNNKRETPPNKNNKNSYNSEYISIQNNTKKEMNKNFQSSNKISIPKLNKNFDELNEHEKNTLDYRIAVNIDKRVFLEYYWSLLKKKHLILFTFVPANDYNLLSIKISLFLLSFSLAFTICGFFMNDETMHKIYEDYGVYNIFHQLLQILYSTVLSAVINTLLRMLSLSEGHILEIKREKSLQKATKKSKAIKKMIKIKIVFFFIFNILLLLFFWYFISCFCVVYVNTQNILIQDTIFSFGLSMLYPFALFLFPAMLRIPALRAKKKDKECLYKLSLVIAYLI